MIYLQLFKKIVKSSFQQVRPSVFTDGRISFYHGSSGHVIIASVIRRPALPGGVRWTAAFSR